MQKRGALGKTGIGLRPEPQLLLLSNQSSLRAKEPLPVRIFPSQALH